MRHRAALLLTFGVLCAPPAQPSAQASEGLVVGLLRADGIALPFARYSDGTWPRLPYHSIPAAFDAGSWLLLPSRAAGGRVQRLVSGSLVYFDPSSRETWYEAWAR